MDFDKARTERQKAVDWFNTLTPAERWELGDQLVLGAFEPGDWGFRARPSAAFMNALDQERMLWEQCL